MWEDLHFIFIFKNTALLDIGFYIDSCSLWALWICYYTATPLFLMGSQLLIWLGFSCKWCFTFLLLLSRVSLCLWILAFLLWCVCGFLLYPTWGLLKFLDVWLMFLIKFGTFTSIIYWNIFSASFFLFSFSGPLITSMLECLTVLLSVQLSSFFFFLFFSQNSIISFNIYNLMR